MIMCAGAWDGVVPPLPICTIEKKQNNFLIIYDEINVINGALET